MCDRRVRPVLPLGAETPDFPDREPFVTHERPNRALEIGLEGEDEVEGLPRELECLSWRTPSTAYDRIRMGKSSGGDDREGSMALPVGLNRLRC